MFAYDSQEDYFAYQDQVAAERRAEADAFNAQEAAHAEAEAAELEGGDVWDDWGSEEEVYASIDAAEEDDHSDIPF